MAEEIKEKLLTKIGKNISTVQKKFSQWEVVQNEKRDLMSLRVKLTWITFMAWIYFLWFIWKLTDKLFTYLGPEKLTTITIQLLDRMTTLFIIVTIVLLIFILAYLLGKNKFHIKAGPLELDVDSNENTTTARGSSSNVVSSNETPTVDPRTGEPIK